MTRHPRLVLTVLALTTLAAPAAAQPASFDEVIASLGNADPQERLSALRYLRQAGHADAAAAVAALASDPVDEVQLEAIATELSFSLIEAVPERRRGFLVEIRGQGVAAQAFERGPLAVWPRAADPAVVERLLAAVNDDNPHVRSEAMYAVGVVARAPLSEAAAEELARAVDHPDPAVRAAAARVIGRLGIAAAGPSLLAAVNDADAQVRYASMWALGRIGEVSAVDALTQQLTYYGKGEGAWTALQALSRIAHPSSVALFVERVADRDPRLRAAAAEGLGRAGDASQLAALQAAATGDDSRAVRVAATFALVKLGQNYVARLVDGLAAAETAAQTQDYLLELGPAIVPELSPQLLEPDPGVRARLAAVVGVLGGDAALPLLRPLTRDRDREVAEAAATAIERIGMAR